MPSISTLTLTILSPPEANLKAWALQSLKSDGVHSWDGAFAFATGAAHGPGRFFDVDEDAVDAEDDGLADLGVVGRPADGGLDGPVAHVHELQDFTFVTQPVFHGQDDLIETPFQSVRLDHALLLGRTLGVLHRGDALPGAIGGTVDLPGPTRDVAFGDGSVEGDGLIAQGH